MLKLLEQLEKENDLLDQLDKTYNQAMDEIPRLSQLETPVQ
jgi:hypothetical protein